jgi:hypothetical protein
MQQAEDFRRRKEEAVRRREEEELQRRQEDERLQQVNGAHEISEFVYITKLNCAAISQRSVIFVDKVTSYSKIQKFSQAYCISPIRISTKANCCNAKVYKIFRRIPLSPHPLFFQWSIFWLETDTVVPPPPSEFDKFS